jgi:hypothetical protein
MVNQRMCSIGLLRRRGGDDEVRYFLTPAQVQETT